MAVVAGLFDSGANATAAMDKLLREDIDDLETKVIDPSSRANTSGPGVVFPVIPNTAGTGAGFPGVVAPFLAGGDYEDWFGGMDDVEQAFYYEGMREGSSLALAKVHDDDAAQVNSLFQSYGARTYVED